MPTAAQMADAYDKAADHAFNEERDLISVAGLLQKARVIRQWIRLTDPNYQRTS